MTPSQVSWPWTATGLLALAALLLVLQRLRIRQRVVRVPTLLFWKQAGGQMPARRLWDRFRHPLTFLLLLAICSLLWLAYANPKASTMAEDGMHILVLDGSANMASGRRFATALEALKAKLQTLPPERRKVLWCGAETLTLLAPGEVDLMLDVRLKNLRPEATPFALAALVRSLSKQASAAQPLTIHLYDKSGPGAADLQLSPVQGLRVIHALPPIPVSGSNHGVVALGVANARSGDWTKVDVYIESADFPKNSGSPLPSVLLDGNALPPSRLRTEPSTGGVALLLEDLPAQGQRLQVILPGQDTLALDDTASVRLPRRTRVRVLLSPSLEELRPALEADPALQLTPREGDLVIRRESEQFGQGLPSIEVVPTEGHSTLEIVHPETIDSRRLKEDLWQRLALDEVEIDTPNKPTALTLSVQAGPHWQIRLREDLISKTSNFMKVAAFPLVLSQTARWLGGHEEVIPVLAAGRPLDRNPGDMALVLLSPTGKALELLGEEITPGKAGSLSRQVQNPPLEVSLLDRESTEAAVQVLPSAPPHKTDNVSEQPDMQERPGISHQPAFWLTLGALALLCLEWRFYQKGRLP